MPQEKIATSERHRYFSALILGGAGVLMVLVGVKLHHPATISEFVSTFLQHLGTGLVAVAFLKFFIEEVAQQQFLTLLRTEVKNQVGTTVISFIRRGSWILNDPRLKQELENSILLPPFTRPYYDLKLKLEPLQDYTDFLKVWITIEYDVKNVSDTARSYSINAWLDDVIKLDGFPPESKPGFRTIKIGSDPQIIEPTDGVQKVGTGTIESEAGMIQLKNLTTPVIDREKRLNIKVEGMQIMRMADHFVWNLPTITHKLTLSIELAGGLSFDQLDVCPREMHHVSHDEFMKTLDDSQKNVWTFRIDHVLLPFQGVELRWAPKVVKESSVTVRS